MNEKELSVLSVFQNKVAVVTGGAGGIGRELCLELARRGSKVYVSDINEAGAIALAEEIKNAGGRAAAVRTDVRDPDAMDALIQRVVSEGPIDYMFNNAGVIMFGEFIDMEYEDWRHFIDSDLMSVVYGTKCAYQVMIGQGHGHIVNVASIFGCFPFALGTGYTAVKQAVVGLTMALRPEAADLNVKVSVACPGTVDTNVRKTYKIINGDRDKFNSFIKKQLPPEKAAMYIIKGVEKNKALIAFPASESFLWLLYKLSPSLNVWWQRKLVKLYREQIKCK